MLKTNYSYWHKLFSYFKQPTPSLYDQALNLQAIATQFVIAMG